MVLPALREENLAKIEEENDKKFECSFTKSERERKGWKLLKKMFETVKELFFLKKNLKYDVRLTEKQVRSIELGRGSQNF